MKKKKVKVSLLAMLMGLVLSITGCNSENSSESSEISEQETLVSEEKDMHETLEEVNETVEAEDDMEKSTEETPEKIADESEVSKEDSVSSASINIKSENESNTPTNSLPNNSSASKVSQTTHTHIWKEHTAQRWISNMVTVDDYETKTIPGARFYTYSGVNEDGKPFYTANGPTYWIEGDFTWDDLEALMVEGIRNADEKGLYNGVMYSGYQNVYKTEKVKVGSHQEDQGYYETYVDYYYCDCGARK